MSRRHFRRYPHHHHYLDWRIAFESTGTATATGPGQESVVAVVVGASETTHPRVPLERVVVDDFWLFCGAWYCELMLLVMLAALSSYLHCHYNVAVAIVDRTREAERGEHGMHDPYQSPVADAADAEHVKKLGVVVHDRSRR